MTSRGGIGSGADGGISARPSTAGPPQRVAAGSPGPIRRTSTSRSVARWRRPRRALGDEDAAVRDRGAQSHRAAHAGPLEPSSTRSPSRMSSASASAGESSTTCRERTNCSAGEASTSLEAHSGRKVPSRRLPSAAAGAAPRARRARPAPTRARRTCRARASAPRGRRSPRASARRRTARPRTAAARPARRSSTLPGSWPSARATSASTCHSARTPLPGMPPAPRGRPIAWRRRCTRPSGARACRPSPRRPRPGRRRRRARGSCR